MYAAWRISPAPPVLDGRDDVEAAAVPVAGEFEGTRQRAAAAPEDAPRHVVLPQRASPVLAARDRNCKLALHEHRATASDASLLVTRT